MSETAVFLIILLSLLVFAWVSQRVRETASFDSLRAGDAPQAWGRMLRGHAMDDVRLALGQFAAERGGRILDRTPFGGFQVGYATRGARARLTVYESVDDEPTVYTQVAIELPEGWPHRLEILPKRLPAAGARGLRSGDADFDARTFVVSRSEDFARQFLDATTREAIDDLRALLANDHAFVSIHPGRLLVRKRGLFLGAHELDLFARLAEALYDRLLRQWQRESGIDILEEADSREHDPLCQVCGHPIPVEARIHCVRCRTPHHRDCWDFNDGCSTYACGEKRFARRS